MIEGYFVRCVDPQQLAVRFGRSVKRANKNLAIENSEERSPKWERCIVIDIEANDLENPIDGLGDLRVEVANQEVGRVVGRSRMESRSWTAEGNSIDIFFLYSDSLIERHCSFRQ